VAQVEKGGDPRKGKESLPFLARREGRGAKWRLGLQFSGKMDIKKKKEKCLLDRPPRQGGGREKKKRGGKKRFTVRFCGKEKRS